MARRWYFLLLIVFFSQTIIAAPPPNEKTPPSKSSCTFQNLPDDVVEVMLQFITNEDDLVRLAQVSHEMKTLVIERLKVLLRRHIDSGEFIIAQCNDNELEALATLFLRVLALKRRLAGSPFQALTTMTTFTRRLRQRCPSAVLRRYDALLPANSFMPNQDFEMLSPLFPTSPSACERCAPTAGCIAGGFVDTLIFPLEAIAAVFCCAARRKCNLHTIGCFARHYRDQCNRGPAESPITRQWRQRITQERARRRQQEGVVEQIIQLFGNLARPPALPPP